MRVFSLTAALGCMICAEAMAQEQVVCDAGPGTAESIATATAFGRTFADGAVTIFQHFADANLPNGALLGVLSPMRGDLAGAEMFEACTLIYSTLNEMSYVNWVHIDDATAVYDLAVGLQITVPIRYYVGGGEMAKGEMRLTVNQAAGSLQVEEHLPR